MAISDHVRQARDYALGALYKAGGFTAVAGSKWRRKRLVILGYHGVSLNDEHEWNPELFVTPAFLRRRFEILRDGGYHVLPLEQGVRSLQEGTLPPRAVVLTFDDGFYNFHKEVMPLLEEFKFPATNYVSTYYCQVQRPIPRVSLDYLLWRGRLKALPRDSVLGLDTSIDLRDQQQRQLLGLRFANAMAEMHDEDRQQAFIQRIAALLCVDWDAVVDSRLFHLMDANEVADAARRGFDMQLHTHHHRTPRVQTEFSREILRNRGILEDLTGRPARHFCYPSGDIDPMFLPWLRELGVTSATTTIVSSVAKATDDCLMLPRFIDTMAKSEAVFASWLAGVGWMFSPKGILAQFNETTGKG